MESDFKGIKEFCIDGMKLGCNDGKFDGKSLTEDEGNVLGEKVGEKDGLSLGAGVGTKLGSMEGVTVGVKEGSLDMLRHMSSRHTFPEADRKPSKRMHMAFASSEER